MSKNILKAALFTVISGVSGLSLAEETRPFPFPGEVTGNIGVFSSYNLRGLTNVPENSDATIQGGLDYSHPSGFYAGYWGSSLDYSLADYDPLTESYKGGDSFEHDFYLGYKGSINEDTGFTIGGTYYYYYNSDVDSDGFETLLGLNYKDFGITAQTLTQNTTWGNQGDTYLLATYSRALPQAFTANFALGAYYYGDDDEFITTTEDFNFRHFTVGLSHPLGDSGANMSLDYIIGGYDRMDDKQKNKVVLGLKYSF